VRLRPGVGIGGSGYHESRSIWLVGYCASTKISENCILFEAAKARIVRQIWHRPHLFFGYRLTVARADAVLGVCGNAPVEWPIGKSRKTKAACESE
jgi:hypothetical protein